MSKSNKPFGIDGKKSSDAESGFETPQKSTTASKSIITPDSYQKKIAEFNSKFGNKAKKIVSDRGIRKADGEVQKTGDRTTPSYYPVIKQSQTGDFSIERSLRKSSHDELFQVAKNKPNLVAKKITPENLAKRENRPNITWQTLDNSLDLKTNNNHPTFVEAHEFARVKNKELHLADKGHTGSIFRNGTSSSSKEGTVSDGYFKTSWDDDKMGIIQKLMGGIKTKEDKESSPEKVTTELLKLAINKVVKYDGDYPKKNPELYTSSGLNLSDEIEREFAFKTSQASRDKWKMLP